ncbi:hypothetical protein HYH03_010187 [Edaphochlamys debaryana]|uniref:Carboxypeptidase n=1 Tax=Edaphochlamys debaryana TaxID=47281 RepID=A0A836BW63_9CHLO|nr:hypothetical protein HYH03_010187 [Edaphochlamys debaryana]|eukprot:KAG2491396.1 hypothetical protein HYH03_010187 [Edaphochlamys debaryana]
MSSAEIRAAAKEARLAEDTLRSEPGASARVQARKQALRASGYTDAALDDLVPFLPGWGDVEGFNLFAGYVTVDDKAGRALFYILAEASEAARQNAANSALEGAQGGAEGGVGAGEAEVPLVLWLNGGPGCSSIGGGFMSELGPWYPLPGGKELQVNPHSWNEFAHVIWLESPAFVGFSYSNTTADAIVGDARTAADSAVFVRRFLDRFPHHRPAPFYVSGESYAGHYVPNLALALVNGNAAAKTEEERVNLQGFLVGNPWTDTSIDNLGAVDYWWSHALISDPTANGIRANCNFSRIGPLDPHPEHANAVTREELCDDFCNKAFSELGQINIYEIYADLCTEPQALRKQVEALSWALAGSSEEGAQGAQGAGAQGQGLAPRLAAAAAARGGAGRAASAASIAAAAAAAAPSSHRAARLAHVAASLQRAEEAQAEAEQGQGQVAHGHSGGGENADPGYDPCVDDEVEVWLNRPEVQAALHANQTVKLPWRWTDCTRGIVYSREDLLSSMLPVYGELMKANLRMLIFSGDVDGIVPVVGTRRWVASLRLKDRSPWRPWYSEGQVGGYIVGYEGLTFATVRGAGHMVPYVQPQRASHMARNWLQGKAL